MSEEMSTMQADQGVLREELDQVKLKEQMMRGEAATLRSKLDVTERDRESRLAAANVCVNGLHWSP